MLTGHRKTQDVLEYVYTLKDSAVSVFWVYAGSRVRFEQDYRKLAKLVELPGCDEPKEDIRPIVKGWLESPKSGDWILVVDNADNRDDFFPGEDCITTGNGLAQFIPRGGEGTVIVTTRDFSLADQLADSNTIRKDMMEISQAVQLFSLHYPKETHHENEPILQLLGTLQHLPLAIVQVAAHLRQNPACSLADYIELFKCTRHCQARLLSQPFNDLRREASNETVLTTLPITFRQVQEQSPL